MSETIEVKVPDVGDVGEVEVVEVLVSPGDEVEKDQGLVTLESDKASMDVPSPRAGKVASVEVKAGDKVSEGTLIARLEIAGDEEPSEKPDQSAKEKEPAPKKAPETKKEPAEAGAPRRQDGTTGPRGPRLEVSVCLAGESVLPGVSRVNTSGVRAA